MDQTNGEVFNNAYVAFTPQGGALIDLSSYVQEVTLKKSRAEIDFTRMGHTSKARKKGLGEWEVSTKLIEQFGTANGGVDIDNTIWTELEADTIGTIAVRPFNGPKSTSNPEYSGLATVFEHGFGGKTGDGLTTGPTFKSAGNLARATA